MPQPGPHPALPPLIAGPRVHRGVCMGCGKRTTRVVTVGFVCLSCAGIRRPRKGLIHQTRKAPHAPR
jgi:hypothetical protein